MLECDTLQVSALSLAERIRRGELRATAVVDAHIRRAQAVNPVINALVAERFAAARAEAAAIDALAADARARLPLAGVPFSVKEMIAAEGMPATYGCVNRVGRVGRADATVVARLRAAGAVLLGVTNVPEWGMWYETQNHVYGRTVNPWNPARTAGGSSGGEGALVAAGGSAFGIGTDIGGSVRMPAAFCGVYGHKPSGGLIPLTGTHPVHADDGDAPVAYEPRGPLQRRAPYLAVGLFTRSAADAAAILRVAAGADGIDPNVEPVDVRDPASVQWPGRRVALLPSPRIRLVSAPARELTQAVQRAGATFAEHGADVVEVPQRLLLRAADIWFSALQEAGGPPFALLLGGGRRVSATREVARALLHRSEYSWPALFFVLGEIVGRRGVRGMRSARAEAARVAAAFDDIVGPDGVLVMPVHPRPAPRHHATVLRPFDFSYTGIFNALRVPATSVPFGFGADGLPLAVQVAARYGRDDLTLAAAELLGRGMPPWRPARVEPAAMATT